MLVNTKLKIKVLTTIIIGFKMCLSTQIERSPTGRYGGNDMKSNLIISVYVEEIGDCIDTSYDLEGIVNIVSRGEYTVINFTDGTTATYTTANIAIYFE